MKDQRKVALTSFAFVLLMLIPGFTQTETVAEAPAATDIRRVNGGNWFVNDCQGYTDLRMDAFGDEAAISFTVNWNPHLIQFLEVKNGSNLPQGSEITVDKSQLALGRLGISIVSPTTFPQGNISIVRISHVTVAGFEAFTPSVTFSSSPTPQTTRDISGNELQSIFVSGGVSWGFCDARTFMTLSERPAVAGTAMVDVNISEFFSQFSGETSFRFSLVWDRSRFTLLSVQPGTGLLPGTTVTLDESRIDQGRVGVSINGTDPLPPFSQNLNLAKLQLSRVAGIDNGSFYVHFSDSPVGIATLDASGVPRFGSGLKVGRIAVGTRTSLTGILRRPSGQPLANTDVTLQGTPLSTRTSSFGVFNFPSISHGIGFRIQVRSKRYRFASLPIYLNHAADVEMRGLE